MSKIKELPLIIYQNTYFTESLYSIINDGDVANQNITTENENSGKAEGGAGLGLSSVPILNKLIDIQLKGEYEKTGILRIEEDKKITASYKFTKIKEHLGEDLVKIEKDRGFENLELGQFVEFTSDYKKNEIRELIDLFLNDNSFDILWLAVQSSINKQADENKSLQQQQNNKNKKNNANNDKQKEEYRKIFNSFREVLNVDFPKENASLDFYGQIKDTGIKNFLICDTKFFVQEDKNRILDGKFKVFGKIIDIQDETNVTNENTVEKTFSQLDRNKFFKRATKEAMKDLQIWIQSVVDSLKSNDKNWFNSELNFVFEGKVIKVLPIVIYT